jgi:hypothetical protein
MIRNYRREILAEKPAKNKINKNNIKNSFFCVDKGTITKEDKFKSRNNMYRKKTELRISDDGFFINNHQLLYCDILKIEHNDKQVFVHLHPDKFNVVEPNMMSGLAFEFSFDGKTSYAEIFYESVCSRINNPKVCLTKKI